MNLETAQRINGWMSQTELMWLASQAAVSKAILEIGSYQGRSTRALCDNSPEGCIVDAVDCWDFRIATTIGGMINVDGQAYSIFHANLEDHIKSGKLCPHRTFFKKFTSPHKYDFIFIDGAHDEKNVRHDITKSLEMLQTGGVISGHDYAPGWPGVPTAVNAFFKNVNVVDSIWWVRIN